MKNRLMLCLAVTLFLSSILLTQMTDAVPKKGTLRGQR